MNLALLILDMQNGYYNGSSKISMQEASKHINLAIDLFRKKNLPIIWICDDGKGGIISGTKEFDVIDILDKRESDKTVHKRYRNGFNKTDLFDYINKNSIEILIITGFSAEYCVLSTYRAAEDYDLKPIMLKNALACYENKNDNIKFIEKISETITINELGKMLKTKDKFRIKDETER
jgi:nicotinamidase-related amidase